MRPARKARGGHIPGVCNRRATPRPGMQRRPNVTGLRRRDTRGRMLPQAPPALFGSWMPEIRRAYRGACNARPSVRITATGTTQPGTSPFPPRIGPRRIDTVGPDGALEFRIDRGFSRTAGPPRPIDGLRRGCFLLRNHCSPPGTAGTSGDPGGCLQVFVRRIVI
jgi:hypothetical protein